MSYFNLIFKLFFYYNYTLVLDIQECVMDLCYEDKHYRFKYPMEVPHIMPLLEPFTREKNTFTLTLMIRTGKKYRKIAKGEINLYKKYFLTEKLSVDKWVYLDLYETQLEQMGHNTNILKAVSNTGKIFMKAQLLDPLLEGEGNGIPKPKNIFDNLSIYTATTHASAMTQMLKNNLKNLPNLKDKAQANKTEKFRSVTEHGNEFLRSLKNKKGVIDEDLYEDIEEEPEKKKVDEFDDGLSDVSISIIDGTEEDHIEIDKMNLDIDNLVNKIKVVFENKIDSILPDDPIELKTFINNVTLQINNIAENYSQNLLTLTDINKRIKFQAKDYYERYKEAKRNFKRERRDLKNKNKMLEYETKMNIEENGKIHKNLNDVKNELSFFKNKVGIKDPLLNSDDDLLLMVEILSSVRGEVDITAGLDEDQKASLEEILEKYRQEGPEDELKKNLDNNEIEITEENYINDEEIIKKIEDIVNENFYNKKITNVKIDQISEDTFKFNNKNVVLYIENDILKVREKGFNNFEEWIIQHFPTTVEKPVQVKKVANGKSALNSIDKKQKAMIGSSSAASSTRSKTPVNMGKKI